MLCYIKKKIPANELLARQWKVSNLAFWPALLLLTNAILIKKNSNRWSALNHQSGTILGKAILYDFLEWLYREGHEWPHSTVAYHSLYHLLPTAGLAKSMESVSEDTQKKHKYHTVNHASSRSTDTNLPSTALSFTLCVNFCAILFSFYCLVFIRYILSRFISECSFISFISATKIPKDS